LNNAHFKVVDEAMLASVITVTFKVRAGNACSIYPAADKTVNRSGHIDVPRHVADAIAAKLVEGVKLELYGRTTVPTVRIYTCHAFTLCHALSLASIF
jgi:hypothetical protein